MTERRTTPTSVTVRDSGGEAGAFTIKSHAAVFDEPCDFGYFTEYIAPGSFKTALAVEPLEVASNWQHDDRWLLGHTLNKTLELEEDDIGLLQWTRVAPTSYASDLRVLIDRGDIQQASFCFRINAEEWEYVDEDTDHEEVKVTITDISVLYDVTMCALGAYSQTDVAIEAGRGRFDRALRSGRIRGLDVARARKRGLLPGEARHTSRGRAARAGTASTASRTSQDSLAKARRDYVKAAKVATARAGAKAAKGRSTTSSGTARTSVTSVMSVTSVATARTSVAAARADVEAARRSLPGSPRSPSVHH